MNATTSAPFGVLNMGPKCWYVQDLATGDISGPTFATKRAATGAAASRNEVRGWTGPVPSAKSPNVG
jgi:hypothetical protein